LVVIEHHNEQERKRLSANHKIAKMTTSKIQTFYKEEKPNRPVRIIRGYTDDQKGKDIQDEDVVRPSNGKWTPQGSPDTGNWKEKSTGRCPTYGTCSFCYKVGPTGKKCVCTNEEYKILFHIR
jgi:hypothetical protein